MSRIVIDSDDFDGAAGAFFPCDRLKRIGMDPMDALAMLYPCPDEVQGGKRHHQRPVSSSLSARQAQMA